MADVLATVKTVLEGGWNSAVTDSVTPTVEIIATYETKNPDMVNKDYIFLYEVSESVKAASLGGTTFDTINTVSLDLRTIYQGAALSSRRAHLIKMKDEALRILKSKLNAPDANFQIMDNYRRRDLSDKSFGLARMVYDVDLINWGVA